MADVAFLTRTPFAHRGLHGGGVVENSRAAFEAAIAVGHGIETDVQVSADGVAMVFHDYELDRLTGKKGLVVDRKAKKLGKIGPGGTDETIPTLAEMLALVAGRVPVLIEIKTRGGKLKKLCGSVAEALDGYPGEAAVMSFNPEAVRWFSKRAPAVVRGLVVTEQGENNLADRLRGPIQRSLSVMRAKPQFLAYDVRDLPSSFARSLRLEGMPVVTWTVMMGAENRVAMEEADQIIYEQP